MNRTRSMGMRSLMNSLQVTEVESKPVQDGTLHDAAGVDTHAGDIGFDARAAKMAEIEARANIARAYRHVHRPMISNLY